MTKTKEVLIFKSENEASDYEASRWRKIAEEAIAERGKFVVALSGGMSPLDLYRKLAVSIEASIWAYTYIFFVDERLAPLGSSESNYALIRDNLINHIPIANGNIHSIKARGVTSEEAANFYQEDIVDFFCLGGEGLPCFDLIILGLGEDGHTGSLFPDNLNFIDQKRLTIFVSDDRLKYDRVSLTLPVINNASNIFFIVKGYNKAAMVKKVLKGGNYLPATLVKPKEGNLVFMLDSEAGLYISRGTQ